MQDITTFLFSLDVLAGVNVFVIQIVPTLLYAAHNIVFM